MKKFLCAVLFLSVVFSLCACGPKTVELTAENWDTYFEFRTVCSWAGKNAFGEPGTSVEYPLALCVKKEYENRILMDRVNLAIECSWEENERYVTVDWEKQSLEWGNIVNNLGTQSRTSKVTEIHRYDAYENACIVVYLRDIGLSADTLLRDQQDKAYAVHMGNGSVVRIQGTITLK